MWPFEKKRESNWGGISIRNAAIKERYPMGSKFSYMGVDMIVCGHTSHIHGFNDVIDRVGVNFNYVSADGVIKTIHYFYDEAMSANTALIKT